MAARDGDLKPEIRALFDRVLEVAPSMPSEGADDAEWDEWADLEELQALLAGWASRGPEAGHDQTMRRVYCAFVLDVFSRRVVGWQVSTSLRTDLALDAMNMGLWTRKHDGLSLGKCGPRDPISAG